MIVNEILQWVALVVLMSFILATWRLIGDRSQQVDHNDTVNRINQTALKTISVQDETLIDGRSGASVHVKDLLAGGPILFAVTDPECSGCNERIRELSSQSTFPVNRTVIVIRADPQSVSEYAEQLPSGVLVVAETRGLALSTFQAPFAVVLDEEANYVGYVSLDDREDVARAFSLLEAHIARMHHRPQIKDELIQVDLPLRR